MSIYLYIYLILCQSIYISILFYIYLSILFYFYLSIYLSIYLSQSARAVEYADCICVEGKTQYDSKLSDGEVPVLEL